VALKPKPIVKSGLFALIIIQESNIGHWLLFERRGLGVPHYSINTKNNEFNYNYAESHKHKHVEILVDLFQGKKTHNYQMNVPKGWT